MPIAQVIELHQRFAAALAGVTSVGRRRRAWRRRLTPAPRRARRSGRRGRPDGPPPPPPPRPDAEAGGELFHGRTERALGKLLSARARQGGSMDFDVPEDIQATLDALDEFIEREIRPLEQQNDNIRFFDHRRE